MPPPTPYSPPKEKGFWDKAMDSTWNFMTSDLVIDTALEVGGDLLFDAVAAALLIAKHRNDLTTYENAATCVYRLT